MAIAARIAASTAAGLCAITSSSTRAAASGLRRRCSQSRTAAALNPNRPASRLGDGRPTAEILADRRHVYGRRQTRCHGPRRLAAPLGVPQGADVVAFQSPCRISSLVHPATSHRLRPKAYYSRAWASINYGTAAPNSDLHHSVEPLNTCIWRPWPPQPDAINR